MAKSVPEASFERVVQLPRGVRAKRSPKTCKLSMIVSHSRGDEHVQGNFLTTELQAPAPLIRFSVSRAYCKQVLHQIARHKRRNPFHFSLHLMLRQTLAGRSCLRRMHIQQVPHHDPNQYPLSVVSSDLHYPAGAGRREFRSGRCLCRSIRVCRYNRNAAQPVWFSKLSMFQFL